MYVPHNDQNCNEHGANWVSNHPAWWERSDLVTFRDLISSVPTELINEGRGNDDSNTAQCVCQNVQEYTCPLTETQT